MTVQEESVVFSSSSRNEEHIQNPASFTCESAVAPPQMAMQMAAQAQGFNGIWRSGLFIFDELINKGLALAPEDQLVGFLYLGTPMLEARKLRELPPGEFVRRF